MSKLAKASGNMYDFVTHLWSPIQGCPHQCSYCYVRKWHELKSEVTFDEVFPNLGLNKKIFICHQTDMFAESVPDKWIIEILRHCWEWHNEYYFQTKNPMRLLDFSVLFPKQSIFGTTIETNRQELLDKISKAPPVKDRIIGIMQKDGKKFLTIEPIMDLDVDEFVEIIFTINPDFVNIGADSKGHHLMEPNAEKIEALIKGIEAEGIEVRRKPNLARLTGAAL